MNRRWITVPRGESLVQLAAAQASWGKSQAEYARRVADAVHVYAFHSIYTACQGPASLCSPCPCAATARPRRRAISAAQRPSAW